MKIDNYVFKCRTCKHRLTKTELSQHIIDNPEHKIILLEKGRAFLLSVLFSASISAVVFALLFKVILEPDINKMIEICIGMISA